MSNLLKQGRTAAAGPRVVLAVVLAVVLGGCGSRQVTPTTALPGDQPVVRTPGGCNLPKFDSVTTPKTEPQKGELIEQPVEYSSENTTNPAKPTGNSAQIDASTLRRVGAEALWAELSEAFQKGSEAPTNAVLENTNWTGLGLTPEEIAFYKSLRSLLNREGQDFSGDDWLRKFRNAGYIYSEVEKIFEKTATGSSARPELVFTKPDLLTKLTEQMQGTFNIEPDKTEGFLRKYPQAGPGKWATLVFYLQN